MGAVAAQAKQAVQLHFLVVFLHGGHLVHLILPDDTHQLEGGAFGAQNGAAHGQNAGKLLRLHLPPLTVDQTGVAVGDANDLHIIAHALIQRLCHAANGGVQAGAVAAGCQDTDPFFHSSNSSLSARPNRRDQPLTLCQKMHAFFSLEYRPFWWFVNLFAEKEP